MSEFPDDFDDDSDDVEFEEFIASVRPAQKYPLFAAGSVLSSIEAILGLIIASFMALAVSIGGLVFLLMTLFHDQPPLTGIKKLGWSIVWVLLSIGVWRSVYMIGGNFERVPDPKPVSIALRQKPRGILLAFFRSLWWLANAAAVLVIGEYICKAYEQMRGSGGEQWVRYAMTGAVLLAAAYASNVYILMAVASLLRADKMLLTIWRFRVLLDCALAYLLIEVGTPAWLNSV